MTTATATAHHTAASSHDCLTESAPEKASGEMKLPETVLNMAWKSMTISTLPPVPLYTHVSTSVQARMITMSHPPICPVATTSGRCHRAHTAPRIRLATSAERPACRLGRANPLQPGSSHAPPIPGIRSATAKVEKRPVQPPISAAEGAWAPSRTFSAVAARAIPTGSKSATAYHLIPTRQRTIRRSRPPIPLLPWVMASTTSAARKGPKEAMGVGERPKAYRIQGHHESAQVSTKNATSGCRFTKDTVHLLPCRVTGSWPGSSPRSRRRAGSGPAPTHERSGSCNVCIILLRRGGRIAQKDYLEVHSEPVASELRRTPSARSLENPCRTNVSEMYRRKRRRGGNLVGPVDPRRPGSAVSERIYSDPCDCTRCCSP